MWDIVVGSLIITLTSVAAFVASDRLVKKMSRPAARVAAVLVIATGALYVIFACDSVWLLKLLPLSNAIVLGNWLPIAAGALAGIAWRVTPGPPWRRAWPVAALTTAGMLALVYPLVGHPPQCRDVWDNEGICRQTTPKSCSAACAATLLRSHGIPATEQEMAALCLTRDGTTWRGIYRGLRIKTIDSPFRLEVFSGSVDQLRQITPDTLLISSGLPRGTHVDPIYTEQWGWKPGEPHTVLLFDFVANERVEMADPDVGREQWTVEDLRVLYRGRGMRLVRRADR